MSSKDTEESTTQPDLSSFKVEEFTSCNIMRLAGNFQIPTRIKNPFEAEKEEDNWKADVDEVLAQIFDEKHKLKEYTLSLWRQLCFKSFTSKKDQIRRFIVDRINKYVDKTINYAFGLKNNKLLDYSWGTLSQVPPTLDIELCMFLDPSDNTTRFSIIFNESIRKKMRSSLSGLNNLVTILLNKACECLNKGTDFPPYIEEIFSFLGSTEVFCDEVYQTAEKILKGHFKELFKNSKEEEEDSIECLAHFESLLKVIPSSISRLYQIIADIITENIGNKNILSFIKFALPEILEKQEIRIATIIFIIRASHDPADKYIKLCSLIEKDLVSHYTFEKLVQYYEFLITSTVSLGLNDVLFILRNSIISGTRTNANTLARELALNFDESFGAEDPVDSTNLLEKLALVSDFSIFQAAFASHLLKRCVERNYKALYEEREFVDKLTEQYGSNKTDLLNSIVNDYTNSNKLTNEFLESNNLPFPMEFIVLDSRNWNKSSIKPHIAHPSLAPVFENFSNFYSKNNNSRTLEWDYNLMNVEITVNGVPGIGKVICNGNYALILLALNDNNESTIESLAETTGISKEMVESLVSTLSDEKYGQLLKNEDGKVTINPDANSEEDIVEIPMLINQEMIDIQTQNKVADLISLQTKIDASIFKHVKGDNKSKENDLLSAVRNDIISYYVDAEMFHKRLLVLQSKNFISIDSSGLINYIP